MTDTYKYPLSLLIITDSSAHAATLLPDISVLVSTKVVVWDKLKNSDLKRSDIALFDVDLRSVANAARLKKLKTQLGKDCHPVIAVDKSDHKASLQANALGIRNIIRRPLVLGEIITTVTGICGTGVRPSAQNGDQVRSERRAASACLAVSDLLDAFTLAVRKGTKLPEQELRTCCIQTIKTFEQSDMPTWMKAVRSHSSYTYRHVMIVTGYAAAFGAVFNMPHIDKERLTLGALVHDIGKVKIPQKILDKPDKLDPIELKKMRQHAAEGAAILRRDGNFAEEVITIARHHHEYLDGSGYPDQLKGDEISDIVRVMTVIDIFSALVEARSYKKPMPAEMAYRTLIEMGPKLDQTIVRAFEPIAFDKGSHELVQRLNGNAA